MLQPSGPYSAIALRSISAACGAVWGLIGAAIVSDTNVAGVWTAFLVSPLIGMATGQLAMRAKDFGSAGRLLVTLLNLYVAVAVFAAVLSLWQVTHGWSSLAHLHSSSRAVMFGEGVAVLLCGFTISGWALILWPLSLLNHLMLWRLSSAEPRLLTLLAR